MRLKGLGWPGRNGGEAGDLFVVVRVEGEGPAVRTAQARASSRPMREGIRAGS
ncbi:hypothetical protein [Streptomyces sp. H27-H1]|uniref:hypothetical protein n=1 Tax=Streptomyces sp. H27-H1 TaxID=2996461 RepID=UPI003B641DCA